MKISLGLTSKFIAMGFTGCVLPLLLSQASAVELMPDFSTVPTGWTTDRYDPTSFTDVGTFQGRNNVLGIEITSAGDLLNRPAAYQSTFYNTQGRQYAVAGGAGSSISADLWIPANWRSSANGSFRTDMWGVMTDGSSVSDYPIIGFSDFGGVSRFRYWDQDTSGGWVDLATTINYDGWNALSIIFTGAAYDYYINGSLVAVDGTIGGSTGFQATIMQGYNFADPSITGANPVNYTAHWSNAQGAPDGGSTVLLLGAACVGLGWLRRRSTAS